MLRGRDSGAPAASGLTEDVLYEKHHPVANTVDSSPFRWFITALHTQNGGYEGTHEERLPPPRMGGQ